MMKATKTLILAGLVVTSGLGVLWFTNRSIAPKPATTEEIQSEARSGGYQLISTTQLWERYKNNPENLLIVDAREPWEYRSGHIKGALNFPMEPTWFSRWRKKRALAGFLGPDKKRFIVFY